MRWFATREANLIVEKFASLFIEHYVRAQGIPTSIVSDCDVRFQSNFWRAFTKAMGTRLRFSTAFHPQTDGLAEKANDTVQTFLRAYATSNVKAWDNLLPLASSRIMRPPTRLPESPRLKQISGGGGEFCGPH